MKTKNSPFSSNTFQKIWKSHFIPKNNIYVFKSVEDIAFYKTKFPFIYCNIGKNLTKGNGYRITENTDLKGKTCIIYDVLPHLCPAKDIPEHIGLHKSIQYPGFLINLNQFKNMDEYLLKTFSKNTRMKMRKFTKRLEECFNISSKMFFGNIDKKAYDQLFEDFLGLLQKRYSDKQITYNNMQPAEWHFYKEVAYPLILEKKASLFVIYDNNTPIAITYSYHTENTVIDAITVFDIDYSKFNIGYINNLKLLNWCFDNNMSSLDFSKGFFDYKKRMSTLEYDFEYHIIYDKKSLKSRITAYGYHMFFEFKTYLRNKNINTKFHELTYSLKNKKQPNTETEIINLESLPNLDKLQKINIKKDKSFDFLTKYVYDYLYLTIKKYEEISIFKLNTHKNTYIISTEILIQQVTFKK